MSQDFAKQREGAAHGSKRRPARAATRNSEVRENGHWGWFLSGILCGFLIVGVGYLGIVQLDEELTAVIQAPSGESDAMPEFNFGFYDELANAEVAVSVDPAPGIASSGSVQGRADELAEPVSDHSRWMLQAGSFLSRPDAENLRARIILLNLNASIASHVLSGRTWHRVMVGPYVGRARANAAMEQLAANNIDPILTRLID